MNLPDNHPTKEDLKKICKIIGCSGVSSECIDKLEKCKIIKKCVYSKPDVLELINN
jgi:hypothetical protein